MKKLMTGILLSVLLLVSTAALAFAADPAGPPPGRGPGAMGTAMAHPGWGVHAGLARMLNLSADQLGRINDLTNRFFAETRDMRYDLAMRRLELARLFTDPKSTDNAIVAKQKEVSALRTRIMDLMAQRVVEGRRVLNAEQLQRLDVLMAPGMGGAGMMGGGMMHGGMIHGGMMGGCPMCGGGMQGGMMGHSPGPRYGAGDDE